MWLNSYPGISGTIPRISGTIPEISGTIPGISGTKKSLSRKRLCRRMMTAEPFPRSLNLKKEYIPGKKGTICKNLFFPFVPFFLHTLELLGTCYFRGFLKPHTIGGTSFQHTPLCVFADWCHWFNHRVSTPWHDWFSRPFLYFCKGNPEISKQFTLVKVDSEVN